MNPFVHGKKHEIGLDLFVKGFDKDRLSRAYLALTNTRETDRLILECATLEEMDAEYNEGDFLEEGIYEAVTVRRFSQTDSRMRALSRVFAKYLPDGITPADAIIGKPRKSGLFASVTAQIPFSDGQAITIVFHSPSGDAKKIGPDDEIIAYRWLLNKRDITHVVSPEGEADVTLEEVGKRIAQLVGKNSARFQATQKDVKAQADQLDSLKTDAGKLSKENMDLMNALKDQQDAVTSTQAKVDRTRELVGKQQEINADLENQLAALQAKQTSAEAERKVAEETAAKEAADAAAQAATDDEAQRIAMEEHQKQQAENDANVNEFNRLVDVGNKAVPGIRLSDSEDAGKTWEFFQSGGMTQEEWDKYAEDLYASGKANRPEPEIKPENTVDYISMKELPPGWSPGVDVSKMEQDKNIARYVRVGEEGAVTVTMMSHSAMVLAFDERNNTIADSESPTMADANQKAIEYMTDYDKILSEYESSLNSVAPEIDNQDNTVNVPDPTITPDDATVVNQEVAPEPVSVVEPNQPEPAATTQDEPPAIATLNDLLSGAHDSDTIEFGRILDEAANELEDAGLMGKYDALLNQTADYLTGLLKEKMKKVM